jgi:thymidine phosphorylase
MVEAQGGDPAVVDDPWSVLQRAPVLVELSAPAEGWLAAVDAEALGRASVELGAGRLRKGDRVDPAVGIEFHPKVGDRLSRGDPTGWVHARDQDAAARAIRQVTDALTVSDAPVSATPLVLGWHRGAAEP